MKSLIYKNLGRHLKVKRIAAGYSQSELAKKLKVHVQFVSNWERGICAPPAHCFQLTLDILKADREKIVVVMLLDAKKSIQAKIFKK